MNLVKTSAFRKELSRVEEYNSTLDEKEEEEEIERDTDNEMDEENDEYVSVNEWNKYEYCLFFFFYDICTYSFLL